MASKMHCHMKQPSRISWPIFAKIAHLADTAISWRANGLTAGICVEEWLNGSQATWQRTGLIHEIEPRFLTERPLAVFQASTGSSCDRYGGLVFTHACSFSPVASRRTHCSMSCAPKMQVSLSHICSADGIPDILKRLPCPVQTCLKRRWSLLLAGSNQETCLMTMKTTMIRL